jgi:hypothetical protein
VFEVIAIRYKLGAVLALSLVVSSCDNEPAAPLLSSGVLSVVVDSSAGPLIRVATITLERAAPVRVTWGGKDTPVLAFEADSQKAVYKIILPRLRGDTEYRLQASIPGEGGVHETTFGTGPLPSTLASIQLEVTGDPSLPVQLVEIAGAQADQFVGLLAVEKGHIVGYISVPPALFGMTRRSNGDIVVLHSTNGLEVHRLDGTVVHRLPQGGTATAYGRIHHDVTATPSNTLLFIADDKRQIGSVMVTGESLWEWNPESGTVIKRWSAFDHLDWATERGRGSTRSVPGNWLHGNGIQYGSRGNVLMSLRNINQVISIAPDFSSVEWKLGGDNGTLAIKEEDRVYGQHYVSESAPNRLLVYDNGFERPGCVIVNGVATGECYTRAVEFDIDPVAMTAKKRWQYRHTPTDIYASLVGSARRLPNGNTTILFGMYGPGESTSPDGSTGPRAAVEVTEEGQVRWTLTVKSENPKRVYRLTPVASLLGEVAGSFQ